MFQTKNFKIQVTETQDLKIWDCDRDSISLQMLKNMYHKKNMNKICSSSWKTNFIVFTFGETRATHHVGNHFHKFILIHFFCPGGGWGRQIRRGQPAPSGCGQPISPAHFEFCEATVRENYLIYSYLVISRRWNLHTN